MKRQRRAGARWWRTTAATSSLRRSVQQAKSPNSSKASLTLRTRLSRRASHTAGTSKAERFGQHLEERVWDEIETMAHRERTEVSRATLSAVGVWEERVGRNEGLFREVKAARQPPPTPCLAASRALTHS